MEEVEEEEDPNPVYNKEKDSDITVNYVLFMIAAAVITSVAISINDTTNIVGAIIFSPLLKPIYGVMIGFLDRNGLLFVKSLITELLLFVITFVVGMITSIILTIFSRTNCDPSLVLLCWPTAMMFRLGSWSYLIVGLVYGSACGVAGALAYDTKTLENFIGVAIAIPLAPPICNSGMMLIYGSFVNLININGGSPTLKGYPFGWSGISFLVFIVNVGSLLLTGTLTLYFRKKRIILK